MKAITRASFARISVGLLMIIGVLYWLPYVRLSWQEEVQLANGESIWVDRGVKADRFGELGGVGRIVQQRIHYREGDESIKWEDDISPILFDKIGGTYFVVAAPRHLYSCEAHNNPMPPFVYYQYQEGHWALIKYTSLPDGLKKNLLLELWRRPIPSKVKLDTKRKLDDTVPAFIADFDKALQIPCGYR